MLESGLHHATGDALVHAWLTRLAEASQQDEQDPAATPVDSPAA
jgi:hypothetical protein